MCLICLSETNIGNKTNIGTTDEITRNQRTCDHPGQQTSLDRPACVLTQALKLAGMETKYRNGQEVSQSLLVNIPAVTENHRDCDVTKQLKCSKKAG